MRPLLGCVLIASVIGSTLSAQSVGPGTVIRARLTGSDAAIVGTLVARTPDTMTVALKGGGLVKIPNASVQGIEISSGRRRLAPALKWAAIGTAIWTPVAILFPYEPCDPARFTNCNSDNTISKSEFVTTQMLGMAIITGAIGAIRGSESWTRVEGQPVAALLQPSRRGTAIGLQLRW